MDIQDDAPNVEELLETLRARVEERRRSGLYPPGLEHELDVHFRHITEHRPVRNLDALRQAMARFEESLVFDTKLIATTSRLPGGETLHRSVARLVSRQTAGIVQQLRDFAEAVRVMLWTMVSTFDDPTHVHADLTAQLDAVLDRLAYYERSPADAAMLGAIVQRLEELEEAEARRQLRPRFTAERLSEELRGSREEVLEEYRDLAGRFAGCAPVVDLGCGRGELLELLGELGVEASGVETDAGLVKAAAERGLAVEHDDALRWLGTATPDSLGGIALLRVVEALSAQELVDVVGLASGTLRPGGRVVVLASNPGSPAGRAGTGGRDPAWVRPVHPAYLTFLFREAGFSEVAVDWRTPPSGGPGGTAGGEGPEYVAMATR